jgi:hypothetical protein
MTISNVIKGAIGKYLPKRRKAPTPDEVGEKYGHLPQDHKRRALCKEAFEAGLELIAKDEVFARLMAAGLNEWWKQLGPLTRDERRATYMRVQEFAKAYLTRNGDPAESRK